MAGEYNIIQAGDGFCVWSVALQETLTEFDTEQEAKDYIANGWARELEDEIGG